MDPSRLSDLGSAQVTWLLRLLRRLVTYRHMPVEDMRVGHWRAQARAARADGKWPMLKRDWRNKRMTGDLKLLGLRVADKVTGHKGIVTCVSYDLNGCIQAVVTPSADEKGQRERGPQSRTNDPTRSRSES